MTREEAVQLLKDLGLNARARDWSMGATILILMGEPTNYGDIDSYPGMLYIAPLEDNQWAIYDSDYGRFIEIWPTLKEAANRAADHTAWWVDGLEAKRRASEYYRKLAKEKMAQIRIEKGKKNESI